MNDLFQTIQAKYNELVKHHNKAAELELRYKSLPDPVRPIAFTTQEEYNAYLQQVIEWKTSRADIEKERNGAKVLHSCAHTELLELLPYTCIWFRMPGTKTWIAKTSNNLTAPGGTHIHVETADRIEELPKLTTC